MRLYTCVCALITLASAVPVYQNTKPVNEIEENVNDVKDDGTVDKEMDDMGIEYGRYLQEVVRVLNDDPEFAKKMDNYTNEQILSGEIARQIQTVQSHVRTKLDELKRIELERLRKLAMKEHKLELEIENGDSGNDENIAGHIDHSNPHTFEAEDLQKLILKATKDLDELDRKRRRDFKQYEMEKEIQYRESLSNMTVEEKSEAERKHNEVKSRNHAKVHHPGSKQQLEQVWQEQDHMEKQEFDPKIFFQMHDVNGDGFLDQEEVEALLTLEVRKLYNEKEASFDQNEMIEEFHRMREHIYKEVDSNHDGLISRKEFLDYTQREEFTRDEGWKGVEEAPVYTEEELKRYEQERLALQKHYAQYGAYQMPYQPEYYQAPPAYYQQHPGQYAGQHPGQPVQYVHVNAPPQHIQQPVQYQHVQLPPQHYQHPPPPPQGHPQQPYQAHPQGQYQQQQPPPPPPNPNLAQLPPSQQQQQQHPSQQPQYGQHPPQQNYNQQQQQQVPAQQQQQYHQPPPPTPQQYQQAAPPAQQPPQQQQHSNQMNHPK